MPASVDIEVIRALYEGEKLGFREVAERLGLRPWQVYRLMQQYNLPRRRGSERNYATYKCKPQFVLKSNLSPKEEQLRVAGAMLYWAEGTKTGKSVDLANCDPELIQLFLAFLRRVCGVAESRLRILLYAYADQDIFQLKTFWSNLMNVPTEQFIKPYVRELTSNVTHRTMPYGLVHVRYHDARLLQHILRWAGA